MKILVISAHPDDLEIGCSGTLKKFLDQGADVSSLIMVKPSKEINPVRNQDIVTSELQASYSRSGIKYQIFETL